ncbi:DNA polymerase Y family protein [Marinobacter bryozoorum]|uniref:Y-family DNA polymerase n=1 Tax=Marinobacter bryozoorum TaxID=256324 RepID=UPI002003ED2F|nr:DNA polymerase Y family protein [Marinobacter bryozoorum]MCK7543342.1 DNA polymerase Y family protein [Marinobacter bryozoorum]
MPWLYLHFHHLLLNHVARAMEADAPLAVICQGSRRVLQAGPRAIELGVRPGTAFKTALNLAPELVMFHADDDRQARILEQQAHWLYHHMDRITLYPPDGLLADAGSVKRLYGGLLPLRKALQEALAERQLDATLSTGPTPLAARLLARAGVDCFTDSHEEMTAHLATLPLTHTEFEGRTLQRLNRLGLTRLGQLQQLPPAELARRLAPETLAHIQRILGQRPDPQTSWQPPRDFRQRADFGLPVEKAQGLLFALQRTLAELENDLQWRQQGADTLLLTLYHYRQEPSRLRIRSTGPEHRAEAFLNLLRIRLEQYPLQAPVEALELRVTRFLDRHTASSADLLGETPDTGEAWHTLVSRLQARLGEQALTHLAPAADHRPERAWSARSLARRGRDPIPEHLPLRPLWLLPHPAPLQAAPEEWLGGPERISGGWWDGERVLRDYYIARLPEGQLAWIYRDNQQGWFVHGWFG